MISTIITKPQSLRAHIAIKIDETSTEQDSPEMATCVADYFPTNEQRQGMCHKLCVHTQKVSFDPCLELMLNDDDRPKGKTLKL